MGATTTSAVPGAETRVGHYRWVICALLFFATTVNYIDRQILALIKEFLDAELGWSNETFGKVNGAFQLSYALGLLLFFDEFYRVQVYTHRLLEAIGLGDL